MVEPAKGRRPENSLFEEGDDSDPKRMRPNCHVNRYSRNSAGGISAQKGGGCARSDGRRGAVGFYLVVAAIAGMPAEAVGVATVLNSFPSHLTVCTIRGIGLTKNGWRTISELSFPGLVPRPSLEATNFCLLPCPRLAEVRRQIAFPVTIQFWIFRS